MFQLKKRPPDYQGRKGKKADDKGFRGKDGSLPPEKLPYLVELSPGTTTTHTHTLTLSLCTSSILVLTDEGAAVAPVATADLMNSVVMADFVLEDISVATVN